MFKLRGNRTTVVGQEMSEAELANVIGAAQQQTREQREFDEQAKKTVDEWVDFFAPIWKPIDATIRLGSAGEKLIQRSLDHDVRWPISDQEAAQREAEAEEKEEQRQKDEAAERERLLSNNNSNGNSAVVDSQQGPPDGGGMPDIPSHMINAPPSDGVQIEISEVPGGGFY